MAGCVGDNGGAGRRAGDSIATVRPVLLQSAVAVVADVTRAGPGPVVRSVQFVGNVSVLTGLQRCTLHM